MMRINVIVTNFNTPLDMLNDTLSNIISAKNELINRYPDFKNRITMMIYDDCSTLYSRNNIAHMIDYVTGNLIEDKFVVVRAEENCGGLFKTRIEALHELVHYNSSMGYSITPTDEGISSARNEYVVFIDSDDKISIDYFTDFIDTYIQNPNRNIYFSNFVEIKDYAVHYKYPYENYLSRLVGESNNISGNFYKIKLFDTADEILEKNPKINTFYKEDVLHSIFIYNTIKIIEPQDLYHQVNLNKARYIYKIRTKSKEEGTEWRSLKRSKLDKELSKKLKIMDGYGEDDPRVPYMINKKSKVKLIMVDDRKLPDYEDVVIDQINNASKDEKVRINIYSAFQYCVPYLVFHPDIVRCYPMVYFGVSNIKDAKERAIKYYSGIAKSVKVVDFVKECNFCHDTSLQFNI